jgi:hypothetical protein
LLRWGVGFSESFDRGNEAVATGGDGFDEAGFLGGVPKLAAEDADDAGQGIFLHEAVVPNQIKKRALVHQAPGAAYEDQKDAKRLWF